MDARFLPLFLLLSFALSSENITALYLSWYKDPTTTMTIQWHSDCDEDVIHYQRPDGQKVTSIGSHQSLSEENILIHATTLEGLEPNTVYSFQINDETTSYTFRTAPANLNTPLRFIIGGDLYLSPKLFRKMGQNLAKLDPLFAVLGGDLAYAIGRPLNLMSSPAHQWFKFLADWQETCVAKDGRLIPFLVVPGNHDIAPDDYELFFNLFAFPKKELYRAVDFGTYLSLLLLDTGHFHPIEGRQTIWLDKALEDRFQTPYLLAVYHIAAYPSYYAYDNTASKNIRDNWCPLFDEFKVQAAFEHHNHTFKKTYPLKAGSKNPAGRTLYFGDGCWGSSPRKTFPQWYLDKRARKNNAYLVELGIKSATITAIGISGEVLDTSSLNPK